MKSSSSASYSFDGFYLTFAATVADSSYHRARFCQFILILLFARSNGHQNLVLLSIIDEIYQTLYIFAYEGSVHLEIFIKLSSEY